MTSIYQRALGDDFQRLHPRIRERFALLGGEGRVAIGRGTMDEVWRGPAYLLPFLRLGTRRHILFPERGRDVPFQVENRCYRDALGRETVSWIRSFHLDRIRRFDAYMVYGETRGGIVDYLGTHQHLAVDLDVSVGPGGGIRFRSGRQRFHEGALSFRIPALFTGHADVCESFDDASGRFRIEVTVRNPVAGPLFGYRGSFDVEWVDAPGPPPRALLPRRLESRE